MAAYLVTYGRAATDGLVAARFDTRTSALIGAGSSPAVNRVVLIDGEPVAPDVSTAQLVEIYNELSAPADRVARFESRAAGTRRLLVKLSQVAVPYVAPAIPSVSQTQAQEVSMPEARSGRKPRYHEDQVVEVLADANPKRAGTAAADRFDSLMALGRRTTVKAALERGVTLADLHYDHEHGYVKVHDAAHHAA